jgi:Zn-dependent protease
MLGSAAALACYFAASAFHNQLLYALAYAGFMINLFNLIPLSPLDGGRITAILSPRVWLFGVPILGALFLWRPSPMLLLVAILALPEVLRAWRGETAKPGTPDYYSVPLRVRVEYACWYLALVAALAMLAYETHEHLGPASF